MKKLLAISAIFALACSYSPNIQGKTLITAPESNLVEQNSKVKATFLPYCMPPLYPGADDGCGDCAACVRLDRAPEDSPYYCIPCEYYYPAGLTDKCQAMFNDPYKYSQCYPSSEY